MANGAVRQLMRRLIPRRVRWLARAAFRRITGLYYRDLTDRLVFDIRHYNETQGDVLELILRRLRVSQEEVAAHLHTVEEQTATQIHTMEELVTSRLSTLEEHLHVAQDEVAARLSTLKEQVATLAGTVEVVQHQVALLRTHLSASGILGPMNLKARTLQRLFEEANANTPREGAVVEIGCIRYPFESPTEGASTLYFARWCEKANRNFISIDAEKEHLENARRLLDAEGLAADLVHADGREAISKLSLPVALLFLDGSNDPRETLEQFKAAEDKLTAGAIVAIDDVQQLDSSHAGKGDLTIPHTKERGWEVELLKTEPGYMMAVLRRAATEGDNSGR